MSRESTARVFTTAEPERERPRAVALVMTPEELEAMIDARVALALAAHAANTQDALTLPANMTVEEAAAQLRCSVRTVHRYLAAKRLESSKIGAGRVLVTRASLERLLATAKR